MKATSASMETHGGTEHTERDASINGGSSGQASSQDILGAACGSPAAIEKQLTRLDEEELCESTAVWSGHSQEDAGDDNTSGEKMDTEADALRNAGIAIDETGSDRVSSRGMLGTARSPEVS